MHSYPNIEKSAFRRGEYVGYRYGVWHIMRAASGWYARHREYAYPGFHAPTLAEVSRKLATIR